MRYTVQWGARMKKVSVAAFISVPLVSPNGYHAGFSKGVTTI